MGSVALKLPQIVKCFMARSMAGLSPLALALELFVFTLQITCRALHHGFTRRKHASA